uniref:Putative secreted protein n=1 Tax=Anopheles darlingi TaxID=43151 RepID=A0A2M4DMV0_ANODA
MLRCLVVPLVLFSFVLQRHLAKPGLPLTMDLCKHRRCIISTVLVMYAGGGGTNYGPYTGVCALRTCPRV